MYCKDCGRYFDEPVVTEMEKDTGAYDLLCPICGSDFIEESNVCECCSDPCREDEEFCEDCMMELNAELEKVKNAMKVDDETLENMIAAHYGW